LGNAVSSQDRPTEKRDKAPPGAARPSGRSGRGADSAMKQLREWEQRRARAALPENNKPSEN